MGGAFLSLAYFDYTYDLMALTVAACAWVRSRGWENEPAAERSRLFGLPVFLGDRLPGRSKSAPQGS